MLSRKHYEAIAGVLADVREADTVRGHALMMNYADKEQWVKDLIKMTYQDACKDIAGLLAYEFSQDNERFDQARFMRACGIED